MLKYAWYCPALTLVRLPAACAIVEIGETSVAVGKSPMMVMLMIMWKENQVEREDKTEVTKGRWFFGIEEIGGTAA
jgi:hypothetical protein